MLESSKPTHRSDFSKLRLFLGIFLPVFLLVVISAVLVTFILPETFIGKSRILFERKAVADTNAPYDPYFAQTQMEVMQSEAVLGDVIDRLNLSVEWGRKYNGGQVLKRTETLELLKRLLKIRPVRSTTIFEIEAFSGNPKEAADIANAFVEAYKNSQQNPNPEGSLSYPKCSVTIIDRALPNPKPVRPNKPLNITLGVIVGIVLGALAGATAVGLRSLIGKKSR